MSNAKKENSQASSLSSCVHNTQFSDGYLADVSQTQSQLNRSEENSLSWSIKSYLPATPAYTQVTQSSLNQSNLNSLSSSLSIKNSSQSNDDIPCAQPEKHKKYDY